MAAFPLTAHAQQAVPVIGFLHSASPNYSAQYSAPIEDGLKELGFVQGQNVTIEYRFADGDYERLPALAADLVQRQVAVIFAAGGTDPAKAAKAATSTIPIVFVSAADPVRTGLVASLSRPGGNITGVSLIASALDAKKMGLLHELVPGAGIVAVLVNPNYPEHEAQLAEAREAAARLGVKLVALSASTSAEIEAAFESLRREDAKALILGSDPFFNSRRKEIVELAARRAVPAIYPQREFVASGGLISYGPSFADGYRQGGVYVGRVLKGEKPADLPILQPTAFETVLSLRAAKALGLSVPPILLAGADEVIE
jgi:putative ABC transport system substrate-binding protein